MAACSTCVREWSVHSQTISGHVLAKLLLEQELDERIGTDVNGCLVLPLANPLQLEPYFSRIRYDSQQKRLWFHDREGVLYGFALAFFIVIKIPLLGVLIYGIAEASTAYLITKITEPPPPPPEAAEFKKRDVRWENKHEFLSLPYNALDKFNISTSEERKGSGVEDVKSRQFT